MQHYISEIQVFPIKPDNGLVGFASVVYNNSFYLGSIGIFTRKHGGYRLTYPTRNEFRKGINVFHPINHEIANEIEKAVITKFEKLTSDNFMDI